MVIGSRSSVPTQPGRRLVLSDRNRGIGASPVQRPTRSTPSNPAVRDRGAPGVEPTHAPPPRSPRMAATPSPQARALTGSDLAILIAVAGIAGVVLVLWLTGELAALIASGRPAPVGARDLGHILIRIPDHLADPARAWPPSAPAAARPRPLLPRGAPRPHHARAAHHRRRAPDAVSQAGADAAAVAPTTPIAAPPGPAPGELHALAVSRAQPGRLILGRARRGRLLATPPDTHLALVAPTRSGKTSRGSSPGCSSTTAPRSCSPPNPTSSKPP